MTRTAGDDPVLYEKEIQSRHSVRKYTDRKIEGETLTKLQKKIDSVNEESGLKIRLVLGEPTSFSGLMTRMTGFRNAVNYIAMIGPKSEHLAIDVGYHGEDIVLYAQSLGLNTCWAMMNNKKACSGSLEDGDDYVIGIAVGYGEDQGVPHKNRPVKDVADTEGKPDWFVNGVNAAMLAPTGVNAQKFRFDLVDGKVVLTGGKSTLKQIDLGIVKFHFECGAGKENFQWSE